MLRNLLQRLLPPRCAACSLAAGDPLCAGCEADFFPASRARCSRCALPLPSQEAGICGRCLSDPPHFESTTALADYVPPIDGMVTALKFSARLDLAIVFGRLLARRAPAAAGAIVAAVPLAFERVAERGFNQSQLIARAFCHARRVPLATGPLRRIRHTLPQQSLKFDERHRNVRGAFEVTGDVRGRTLLIVDDVMTTGSTLNEIARILRQAGAARVDNLVVARTP
jgi:ComF family protein